MMLNGRQKDLMNRALDGQENPDEREKLAAWLGNSPADAALWERMLEADRLLHQAPLISPPDGFSARVMARVRPQGEPDWGTDGLVQAVRLAVAALMGVGVLLALRFALISLIGPLPDLDAVWDQLSAWLGELERLLPLLRRLAESYPMLPAMGLSFIPLAFALAWLAAYYMPRDRLRRAVMSYLPLS
jgi:hypothetical protein